MHKLTNFIDKIILIGMELTPGHPIKVAVQRTGLAAHFIRTDGFIRTRKLAGNIIDS